MKVVIDIPKWLYKELTRVTVTHAGEAFAQKLISYIKNGTPLEAFDKAEAEIGNSESED